MRAILFASMLAFASAASSGPGTGDSPTRIPLRGADCLDPGSARSWHEVSSTEILVDAGRRKYRITLRGGCSLLGHGPGIAFAGDPISGRVCGNMGDAVVLKRGERCSIARIELIDKATWNASGKRTDDDASGGARR
jgi:hypothetical protein